MRKTTKHTHLFNGLHATQIEVDSSKDLQVGDILVFAKITCDFDYEGAFFVREFATAKRGHIEGNAIVVRLGREHGNSMDPTQLDALIATKAIRVFTASPNRRYVFVVRVGENGGYITYGDFPSQNPYEDKSFDTMHLKSQYVFKVVDSETAPFQTIKSSGKSLPSRVSHQVVFSLLLAD